jgi:predicted ATPase
MYQRIELENLRGIDHLSCDGLRRINLIVGKNNAGKTTLLEAFFLLGGATNPFAATILGQLRGQQLGKVSPDPLWRPLFRGMDPQFPIRIAGNWKPEHANRMLEIEAVRVARFADSPDSSATCAGQAAVTQDFAIGGLRMKYRPAGRPEIVTTATFDPSRGAIDAASKDRNDFVKTTFLSARAYSSIMHDARQFSYLLKVKREQDVLDALRLIEPRIERIEVISDPDGSNVYVDIGLDSLVPLAVCGEGFARLFSIVVELAVSRGGVLLIDEIDNGLHYSVMDQLWLLLGKLAEKHDVQVIGTTHNEDLLRSSLRAFKHEPESLSLLRIDLIDGRHSIVDYDEDSRMAILEEHFEVRG